MQEQRQAQTSAGSAWSCLTLTLGVFLLLLTLAICIVLVGINTPSGGPIGPPPVSLLIVAMLPIIIVSGVLVLILGRRVRLLWPVALLMVAAIGLTWGAVWISNASKTYASPEIVGVVTAVQADRDGMVTVTLANGRVMTLNGRDPNSRVMSTSGHYRPLDFDGADVGALLLAGEGPTPWYITADKSVTRYSTNRDGPHVCYAIESNGWISNGRVRLVIGLELVDRSDDPFGSDSTFGSGVCLDESGAVVEFLSGGY